MGYAIVAGMSAAAGVSAYLVTMRRSVPRDNRSFEPGGPAEMVEAGDLPSGYIPVVPDASASWRSRSIGVLGLVALVLTVASVLAISLYQFGGMLIRLIIEKLQNS